MKSSVCGSRFAVRGSRFAVRGSRFAVCGLILLLTLNCQLSTTSEAAGWEKIPAPPEAEKLREEKTLLNNIAIKTTFYRSESAAEQILGFYKMRLPKLGWSLEADIDQQGIRAARFTKGNRFVNVMIHHLKGKNFITIAQGEQPKEVPQQDVFGKAMLKEDAPGKDLEFVPRYPNSIRLVSIEREHRKSKRMDLTYCSQDKVERVLDYYYDEMPAYNWTLVDEIDFADLPQQFPNIKQMVSAEGAGLIFTGPRGQCLISVIDDPEGFTLIGVKFNAQ